jgi:hypothetical protein
VLGWINQAERIFNLLCGEMASEEIIFLLGITPIKKWKALFRILTKAKNVPDSDQAENSRLIDSSVEDISLEFLKYENLMAMAENKYARRSEQTRY